MEKPKHGNVVTLVTWDCKQLKAERKQAEIWHVERLESEQAKRKQAKRKQAIAELSQAEISLVLETARKLEHTKRSKPFMKAEVATLELASEIAKGNLPTYFRNVTLRHIAKRLCTTIVERVQRSERKAKSEYMPMDYIPLDTEASGLYDDSFYNLGYAKRYVKPKRAKVDKVNESEFRQAVDNMIIELSSLPSEIQTYFAIAYVMSTKAYRHNIWHNSEDCFQSVLVSLIEATNGGKRVNPLISDDKLLDIGFNPVMSERQAYHIGKISLAEYYRRIYKRSKEISLADSYIGDDSIISLPNESIFNRQSNSESSMLSESMISREKLRGLNFAERNMLNQSKQFNDELEADLIIGKAEAKAKAEQGKLKSERQAIKSVLRDNTEYSRIAEAEADVIATLRDIKDKRFRKLFIQVKQAETLSLAEALPKRSDYEYMKRYVEHNNLNGLRVAYKALNSAKLAEVEPES